MQFKALNDTWLECKKRPLRACPARMELHEFVNAHPEYAARVTP